MLLTQQFAGWAGAALAFGANLYYVFLIRRDAATPHPVTWAVWALIGALGASSAVSAGAGAGSLVPVAYAAACAVTSYVAVQHFRSRRGSRPDAVTRYDLILGGAAVTLALLWQVADLGPGWLALLAVVADAFALWPTLRYAWTRPTTRGERAVWTVDAFAALLGLCALAQPWRAAAAAYPIYLLLGNGAVALLVRLGPMRNATPSARANWSRRFLARPRRHGGAAW